MKTVLAFFTLFILTQQYCFAQYGRGKCDSGSCENGFGVYKFDNGSRYEGNWKNGRFHGEGKYFFISGNYYEGQFVEGKKHGKGKYSFTNKITFTGNFVNDTIKGLGNIVYQDGSIYDGEIYDFKMQGKGKLTSPEGIAFSGIFSDDSLVGDGKIRFKNGSTYEGNLEGMLMEGKGKYIDSSGFTYTGEFKANRFDGFGERKETDGFIYIGEFKKDIRHGLGTLIYTNGSKITAKWDYDSITSENLKVEIKNDKQIPLIPYANGLYKIPVRINNALDLLLLFDTGVSETIIDDRNIQYLINKNIISENDVLRTSEHKFADGFKRKKITYKINSLVIGKYPIDNPVLATFEDENVELILGNKMISKLGKIQIDYKNHILTIVK